VKIKGTCRACSRDFMVEQVIEAGGSCPWCGTPFNPNYAMPVVERLADAVDAGDRLEKAVEELADLRPSFSLEVESVIGKLRRDLARLEGNLISRP
jgi:hypothetical protein